METGLVQSTFTISGPHTSSHCLYICIRIIKNKLLFLVWSASTVVYGADATDVYALIVLITDKLVWV